MQATVQPDPFVHMFLFVALKEARRLPPSKSMSTLRYGAMRELQFHRKKIFLGSVTGRPGYTSDFSPACCSMVWDRDVSRLTGLTRRVVISISRWVAKRTRWAVNTSIAGELSSKLYRSKRLHREPGLQGCQSIG